MLHHPNRSNRKTSGTHRSRSALFAGVIGLSVALFAPGLASAATTTADDVGCPGHWPASVQGKPAVYHAGARAGDYLWHDARGWHLRVTKVSAMKAVFTGRIRSDRPMRVSGVALEAGDTFTLSADRLTLTYRFSNFGHVDGMDIRTDCANRLGVYGAMNGTRLPTSRIWLGVSGRHPLQNPFVIARVH